MRTEACARSSPRSRGRNGKWLTPRYHQNCPLRRVKPAIPATPPALQLVPTGQQVKPGQKQFVKSGAKPNLLDFHLSDHGNAQRLIVLYGPALRYCHVLKKWIVWDGKRWVIDYTEQARQLARLTMVEFLRQTLHCVSKEKQNYASASLNANSITSIRVGRAARNVPIGPS
jgi:hypothetical protein